MQASRPWPRAPRHALPRTLTPFAYEAASSYAARLAAANHIGVYTLRYQLAESATARVRADWLSVVSGQPETLIAARLCGLAGDSTWLPPQLRRPLCRECMLRKGIRDPVYCYSPPHVTVCHRHQRWTGPGARQLADQLDLGTQPTVLQAGRTHRRLARQHPSDDVQQAIKAARHMLAFWARAEHDQTASVLQNGLAHHVAAYPGSIAVANALLARQARMTNATIPAQSDWPTNALKQINLRTQQHHALTTPLEQWQQNLQLRINARSRVTRASR